MSMRSRESARDGSAERSCIGGRFPIVECSEKPTEGTRHERRATEVGVRAGLAFVRCNGRFGSLGRLIEHLAMLADGVHAKFKVIPTISRGQT